MTGGIRTSPMGPSVNDGGAHLAYSAGHAVDRKTAAIVARCHGADEEGDDLGDGAELGKWIATSSRWMLIGRQTPERGWTACCGHGPTAIAATREFAI